MKNRSDNHIEGFLILGLWESFNVRLTLYGSLTCQFKQKRNDLSPPLSHIPPGGSLGHLPQTSTLTTPAPIMINRNPLDYRAYFRYNEVLKAFF